MGFELVWRIPIINILRPTSIFYIQRDQLAFLNKHIIHLLNFQLMYQKNEFSIQLVKLIGLIWFLTIIKKNKCEFFCVWRVCKYNNNCKLYTFTLIRTYNKYCFKKTIFIHSYFFLFNDRNKSNNRYENKKVYCDYVSVKRGEVWTLNGATATHMYVPTFPFQFYGMLCFHAFLPLLTSTKF